MITSGNTMVFAFFQPKLGFNSPVAVPPYRGMLFLYKLRAFENVVEWLPVFIIHAVALVALGKTGTCVLLCVPYTIGCLENTGEKLGKCGKMDRIHGMRYPEIVFFWGDSHELDHEFWMSWI